MTHLTDIRSSGPQLADLTTFNDLPFQRLVPLTAEEWYAVCICGWISPSGDKWHAERQASAHKRIAKLLPLDAKDYDEFL